MLRLWCTGIWGTLCPLNIGIVFVLLGAYTNTHCGDNETLGACMLIILVMFLCLLNRCGGVPAN